jgi:hypothetical protein
MAQAVRAPSQRCERAWPEPGAARQVVYGLRCREREVVHHSIEEAVVEMSDKLASHPPPVVVPPRGMLMDQIKLVPDLNGRWMVLLPDRVIGDLSREVAEAFVAAYRRMKAAGAL